MKTILVAVQDEALGVYLSEVLTEEAYGVILCADVVSLIRDIDGTKPHMVLMDEEFGGGQKSDLHKLVRRRLGDSPLITLWRGNRPKGCRSVGHEGFALRGSNLTQLKEKIADLLDERSAASSESRGDRVPLPFTQTAFQWAGWRKGPDAPRAARPVPS